MDQIIWWKATELQDLQKLIVVVLAREYGRLNEEFDGCAAQTPHVYAAVIHWHDSLISCARLSWIICSK